MKVLVTAASKHGSTAEIASVIAAVLRTSGIEVDVTPPESVEAIDGYDAVVLGSGVYASHWLQPAKAFVDRWEDDLGERPVFLFSSGPLGELPKPTEDPIDVEEIDRHTHAVDHQVFAGRLTRSEMSLPEKMILTVVRAPDGDFRPWDDISDWANEIARFLLGTSTAAEVGPG